MNSDARVRWYQFVAAYFGALLVVLGFVDLATSNYSDAWVLFVAGAVLGVFSLVIRWASR